MKSLKSRIYRTTLSTGVAAIAFGTVTASAASFSNPGAAVSVGTVPFQINCTFSDYGNDGAHSATSKRTLLPNEQVFSFADKAVHSADGTLQGYVIHASGNRIDWRMETGKTGSPIYRFTQLRGTNEIFATVTMGGPTGAGGKATAASNPGKDSHTVTPLTNPGGDSATVNASTNPAANAIRSPMSNIKGSCS